MLFITIIACNTNQDKVVEKKPKVKKIAIGIGKAKDYPGIKKIMEMNKKGKKRFKDGGSAMKPVDKSKNPGLAKLPTQVRNKMGYMKKGGAIDSKKVKGMKKGGKAKSRVNEAGNYTKPTMRKRLFSKIKAGTKGGKAGQWSARKAQLLASEYKKSGGGYK